MSNHAPDNKRATDTVTVRLPKGMADKIRAASGMGLSPLVRKMLEQFLARHIGQQHPGLPPSNRDYSTNEDGE